MSVCDALRHRDAHLGNLCVQGNTLHSVKELVPVLYVFNLGIDMGKQQKAGERGVSKGGNEAYTVVLVFVD